MQWTDTDLPGLRLCHLKPGNSKLELIGGGQPLPLRNVETVEDHLEPAGVIHLCLTVDDLESTTAALRPKGVAPFAGPIYVDALDITLVIVKDNSGNVLEIAQRGGNPSVAIDSRHNSRLMLGLSPSGPCGLAGRPGLHGLR